MKNFLAAGLCLAVLVCLGCGSGEPDLGQVTGTVTMDGSPLPNAMVTFVPVEGGRASTGATDSSGKYTLGYGQYAGAEIGKHKVKVTSMSTATGGADPEMRSDSDAYMKQATSSASDYDNATVKESIPAKYNTATELEYEVTGGKQEINLDLKSS